MAVESLWEIDVWMIIIVAVKSEISLHRAEDLLLPLIFFFSSYCNKDLKGCRFTSKNNYGDCCFFTSVLQADFLWQARDTPPLNTSHSFLLTHGLMDERNSRACCCLELKIKWISIKSWNVIASFLGSVSACTDRVTAKWGRMSCHSRLSPRLYLLKSVGDGFGFAFLAMPGMSLQ